jgi:hypothetical protein
MNGCACHGLLLSSVIVDNLNAQWVILRPFKTDAPLVVDPNGHPESILTLEGELQSKND